MQGIKRDKIIEVIVHVLTGRDAGKISTGPDNLIWRTALQVASDVGEFLPPVAIEIHNDIPLGKGLGSSAAALTAGVVIADHLLGLNWKPPRVLDEAARIEGHPDNVAACVLGSIVASAIDDGGVAHAVRLELPPKYGCAVVVPDFELPTKQARSVLPESYSRADAVFNIQRSALLIAALITGNTSAFPAALQDRIRARVADAEVLLVGLAGDQVRRRRLADDDLGDAEVAREGPDLRLEEVAERVDRR